MYCLLCLSTSFRDYQQGMRIAMVGGYRPVAIYSALPGLSLPRLRVPGGLAEPFALCRTISPRQKLR